MDDARKVKVGMTKAEVTTIMGNPNVVKSQAGEEVWVWSYVNGFMGRGRVMSIGIKDGKVTTVPTIPDSMK